MTVCILQPQQAQVSLMMSLMMLLFANTGPNLLMTAAEANPPLNHFNVVKINLYQTGSVTRRADFRCVFTDVFLAR